MARGRDGGGAARRGDAGAGPAAPGGPSLRSQIAIAWSRLPAPAAGPPQAIGAYAGGCLQGGVPLPFDGPNHRVLRVERRRYYGHPALVAYVRRLARAAGRARLGVLFVGDLSQPRGGPTPTGHRSHQTGLDVDLWYAAPAWAARRRPSRAERAQVLPDPVVDLRAGALTRAWRPTMADLLRLAAVDPQVDRLFVHPAVKRELCARTRGPRDWLARVRPWWGHHDHFHVRLRCPEGEAECQPLDPLPPRDGCDDQALGWWFGPEVQIARERRATAQAEAEGAPPPLPARCQALLE